MTPTKQFLDEVTRIQQMMARYDDSGREIFGAYAVSSRLFEMEPDFSGPKMDANGLFICKFTDDDLVIVYGTDDNGKPRVTAQEFATAFFGAVNIANAIPTELADLIGRIRA